MERMNQIKSQLLNNFKLYLENNINGKITDEATNAPIQVNYNTKEGVVLQALMNAMAQGFWLIENKVNDCIINTFVQTCTSLDILKRHGWQWGVEYQDGTNSSGIVIFEGIAGTVVPKNSKLSYNGLQFETLNQVYILEQEFTVVKVVNNNTVLNIELTQDIDCAIGQTITLNNSNVAKWNKEYKVIGVETNLINNTVVKVSSNDSIGVTDNNSHLKITSIYGSIKINCTTTGKKTNANAPATFILLENLIGVNKDVFLDYKDGLKGGYDPQTITEYRNAILNQTANPSQGWNINNVYNHLRSYNGEKYKNAFIFIPRSEDAGGILRNGYSTIYILKQNLDGITSAEEQALYAYFLSRADGLFPIDASEDNFSIKSPDKVFIKVSYQLSQLYNTEDNKRELNNNLKQLQFTHDKIWYRKNVYLDDIKFALQDTIGPQGRIGQNVTLTEPNEGNTGLVEFDEVKRSWYIPITATQFPILQY
jgi:hypothetical protein